MSIKIKSECSIRTPFEHSVTIPSDTSLPESVSGECKCYYIQPRLHRLGMVYAKTTFGNQVRCYNAERSICDMLRSRNRMDEAMSLKGKIKNYAKSNNIAAQVVLQNYMFECLLARLAHSSYKDKFVVKGGYAGGGYCRTGYKVYYGFGHYA